MKQVKFTTFGANSAFGSFAPGDTMRCSPEMARHLVEEIKCAKYLDAVPVATAELAEPVDVATKKRKAK